MARAKTQPVIQTDDDTLYYERCAGIDVHKKVLIVCLRIGRKTESREHGTTTGEMVIRANRSSMMRPDRLSSDNVCQGGLSRIARFY